MLDSDIQYTIKWFKQYHRLTNYLSSAMLYLKDNYFLEDELKPEHIKDRILGHWGTVPGLNFVYGGLNYLISRYNANILPIIGPGHGAPAVLASLLLEETLGEYYPRFTLSKEGMENLIKEFSWPNGFPSHTYPGLPGTIHEGGELGYSLGLAFGAALDNPDLIVTCVVGDGEAETGPLAASWQFNKFLNPQTDGAVLPILHLNSYRISGPTLMGTMSHEELENYFKGLGYEPLWVDQYTSIDIYIDFLQALIKSFHSIQDIKSKWSSYGIDKPKWPVIILKTKKGWTCPEEVSLLRLEDFNYSHGIPIKDPKNDAQQLKALERWLRSYRIDELLEPVTKVPKNEVLHLVVKDERKMGKNKHAFGGEISKALILPDLKKHGIQFDETQRGKNKSSEMAEISEYFSDLISLNKESKNFRIFSPDESESNKLEALFKVTSRKYIWPVRSIDTHINEKGLILEILSEHTLQSWMQGYSLTGRHGVLVSYEAFLSIITSQIEQYIKYIKQSSKFSWRKPLPSMNYIATSTIWRQEHNGFTHQNPALINTLLSKYSDSVNIYFPSDTNTLLYVMEESLKSKNSVNLIISDKREMPQWLNIDEAKEHVKRGISVWDWASTDVDNPDVVLASSGDYQTTETLAAITLIKKYVPELKVRYVNVNELSRIGLGDKKYTSISETDMGFFFTNDKPIVFNFHGYPEAIKLLTWGHPIANRMKVIGYIEEGTTTTPFDMQVLNGTSRFHVVIEAVEAASKQNTKIAEIKNDIIYMMQNKLRDHRNYIIENGDDMPEIKNWQWE